MTISIRKRKCNLFPRHRRQLKENGNFPFHLFQGKPLFCFFQMPEYGRIFYRLSFAGRFKIRILLLYFVRRKKGHIPRFRNIRNTCDLVGLMDRFCGEKEGFPSDAHNFPGRYAVISRRKFSNHRTAFCMIVISVRISAVKIFFHTAK